MGWDSRGPRVVSDHHIHGDTGDADYRDSIGNFHSKGMDNSVSLPHLRF